MEQGIRVSVDGLTMHAVLLDDVAPKWSSALRELLPLEGVLRCFRWGGEAAYFLEHRLVKMGDLIENPVTFYPRMSICIRPSLEVVFPYGQAQARSLTIPAAYACHVADLEGDRQEWTALLRSLSRSGERRIGMTLA